MMRGLAIVAALAGAHVAAAHPMLHFDLAGLVRDSDAIVYAERIKIESPSRYSHIDHYRVTRVVKGKLAKGDEVAVEEELYGTDGAKLDPTAVLFLAPQNGKLELVSSGLRVVKDGGVYRFEQWDNPGGWTMVPQGNDPRDIWLGAAKPIDLATFGHELDAAQQRVDALAAALALRDRDRRRTAVLALFAPPGGSVSMGFFRDELAQAAETALVAAGDLDGALLVRARDRTSFRFKLAPRPDLIAIANDGKRATELRVAAIGALDDDFDTGGDPDTVHALLALLVDAVPAVRAAAVAAARPRGAMSSDPKENAKLHALEHAELVALQRRFVVETDPDVLYEFTLVLDHLPARSAGPAVVARAEMARGLAVHIRCLHAGTRVSAARVPGATIDYTCGGTSTGLAGASGAPGPGRHELVLEATVDGKPITQPLGTLVVGADGSTTLSR